MSTHDATEQTDIMSHVLPVRILNAQGKQMDERLVTVGLAVRSGIAENEGGSGMDVVDVVHIELTDEADPFFLYSLQVSETDYHVLKQDQELIVDFRGFPEKMLSLLQLCCDKLSRFSAVLRTQQSASDQSEEKGAAGVVGGGLATFAVVETNAFKHVRHIALRVVAADDTVCKEHLGAVTVSLKAAKLRLEGALASLRREHSALEARLDGHLQDAEVQQREHDRDMDGLRQEHMADVNQQTQAHLQERAALQERFETEAAELRQGFQQAESLLRTQLRDTSEQLSSSQTALRALEGEQRDTAHQLTVARSELADAREHLKELKDAHSSLQKESFGHRRVLNEVRLANARLTQQVSGLQDKVSDAEALQVQQRAQIKRSDELCAELSDRVAEQTSKYELCVAEIHKGNRVIQCLQAELKTGRQAAKVTARQTASLTAQVAQLQAESKQSTETRVSLEQELAVARAELKTARSEKASAAAQLATARKQLLSNAEVIEWLNRELNEAKLGSLARLERQPWGKISGWADKDGGGPPGAGGSSGHFSSAMVSASSHTDQADASPLGPDLHVKAITTQAEGGSVPPALLAKLRSDHPAASPGVGVKGVHRSQPASQGRTAPDHLPRSRQTLPAAHVRHSEHGDGLLRKRGGAQRREKASCESPVVCVTTPNVKEFHNFLFSSDNSSSNTSTTTANNNHNNNNKTSNSSTNNSQSLVNTSSLATPLRGATAMSISPEVPVRAEVAVPERLEGATGAVTAPEGVSVQSSDCVFSVGRGAGQTVSLPNSPARCEQPEDSFQTPTVQRNQGSSLSYSRFLNSLETP